jgi:hypothetical protein
MTHAQVTTGRYRQVAGWTSLAAGAVLLASLFNAVVTDGTAGVEQAAPAAELSSVATAALADGDDVRARFLLMQATANAAYRQYGIREGTSRNFGVDP